MNRRLLCCCAIPLVFAPILAGAQAAPAATQTSQPQSTLHANADLVLVDVVASDREQNPIHQLTAKDFTVFEDGKPQTVKAFEEHVAGPPPKMPPLPKFAPGVFTNFSQAPETGSLNILLLDKLNTPLNAQTEVRDQVLQYLKKSPPGTPMAIFSLTTELKLLQGFTSDPELLRALVMGKKGNEQGSPLMNNQMEGDQPGQDDPMMDMTIDIMGNSPDAATVEASLQQFEAEQQSFQIQLRQRFTLDALNQLARYMAMLPGRKNLIWFSGSFPITILPDPDLSTSPTGATPAAGTNPGDPFAVAASAADEFRETVDLLSRSQVAVYPIDARGLMTEPMLNASQSGSTMNRRPNGFANANSKWFSNTANEQGTMQQMAEATGGRAFMNTNGLKEAVEKAVEIGSNYYTIAYTPQNRNWNGDFRKIAVKVDKPGVTLAYRRGYFADDPGGSPNKNAPGNALSNATQYDPLRAAMMRGAPDPTELIFVATVRPSTSAPEDAAAQGNQLGKKVNGPFRRYTVSFLTNPRQVDCAAGPDGVHHCQLEFLTFVYSDDGTLVNMQTNGINAGLTESGYAAAMSTNFSFRQQVSVPVKGEYYLRLGMRDRSTGNVGALELPVEAVARLPLQAEQSPAPADKPAEKAADKPAAK
jgi:VWFA-related protein